jgi:hypothetical protein
MDASQQLILPLQEALLQEGYYNYKPACYTSDLVNADSPECLTGSPWITSVANDKMADSTHFKNPNVRF